MNNKGPDPVPGLFDNSHWTLIRGARQLLTLGGACGPRRGSALADLNIIADGALLIRDGIIDEAGPTRRVENLAPARFAREIDATGKVVMPAFIDPDVAIAAPNSGNHLLCGEPKEGLAETDIRRMSRRRLESQASKTVTDLARYGVITAGVNTLLAPDLQNSVKALRLHRAMQLRPLRILSVFSPPFSERDRRTLPLREPWMSAIFAKKLAPMLEIPLITGQLEAAGRLASAAASFGFSIRFRVSDVTTIEMLELAYSAGAVSVIGQIPRIGDAPFSKAFNALADSGCVSVALAAGIADGYNFTPRNGASKRAAMDGGPPLALASGYRSNSTSSLNPQYLLFLACQNLGMTAEEAIVATTYNAAHSLRLSHVTGSLDRGKSADICMMDVDDYRELPRRAGHHDVCMVMRAGKVIYRRSNLDLD